MTGNRQPHTRPYFFELFTLANLGAIVLLSRDPAPFFASWRQMLQLTAGLAIYAIGGVVVRIVIAAIRKQRGYLRIIRSRAWLIDTVRLGLFSGLLAYTYGWIKILVPLLHPRLLDQALWDLDRKLLFGMSPNILFLDLFANPRMLRFIDWTYGQVFVASMTLAFGFFLSAPSRRIRIAFANGNAALWLIGAWLYVLVPSLGPVFRFPDLWFAHEKALPRVQLMQVVLMHNYQNVLKLINGRPGDPVNLLFGIAAFPSMHVAFQSYVFFWMRRVWRSGEIIFAIFVFVIFLGSIVTGWHYMIDGIAGFALAAGCYFMSSRLAKMPQFRRVSARFPVHASNTEKLSR